MADAKVQSLAAEILAKRGSDYESPADGRRSFAQKLEDRAKLERYPPIRGGRPGHLQPIRLADIIGSLNGGKCPSIDVCFSKLAQLEARIAQRNAAKKRAAVEQQKREAELHKRQDEQRIAAEQQKRKEEDELRSKQEGTGPQGC